MWTKINPKDCENPWSMYNRNSQNITCTRKPKTKVVPIPKFRNFPGQFLHGQAQDVSEFIFHLKWWLVKCWPHFFFVFYWRITWPELHAAGCQQFSSAWLAANCLQIVYHRKLTAACKGIKTLDFWYCLHATIAAILQILLNVSWQLHEKVSLDDAGWLIFYNLTF
jgi:hypothetical protein